MKSDVFRAHGPEKEPGDRGAAAEAEDRVVQLGTEDLALQKPTFGEGPRAGTDEALVETTPSRKPPRSFFKKDMFFSPKTRYLGFEPQLHL